MLAHQSQLVPVPDHVSDENAVLAEPFACSLHPILRYRPRDEDTVLVIGCGVIGLTVIAALRAVDSRCRIVALARYEFQERAARALGADVVIRKKGMELYREVAEQMDARLHRPPIGKPVLEGGASTVFECVGRAGSLDDALRMAGQGGRVILLGLASMPKNVDWTPIWQKELQVLGSFLTSGERLEGKPVRTTQIAIDLMARGKVNLESLVTHRFRLEDYPRAFSAMLSRGKEALIKAVFDFTEARTSAAHASGL